MKTLLAGVATIAIATLAIAQPPAPPLGGPPAPIKRADVTAMVTKHFTEIDTNKDGAITEAEIRAFRRTRMKAMMAAHRDEAFARLDADKSGSLSRQEFDNPPPPAQGEAPPPPREAGEMPPPPPGMGPDGPHGRGPGGPHGPGGFGFMPMGGHWFEKADANQDGKVTLAEAKTAALAAFDKADTNHDGVVDGEEMRAQFVARRGPGDDMPPPPPGN